MLIWLQQEKLCLKTKKYLTDVTNMCKRKTEEHGARSSERVEELQAISKALEILSADSAQAAFKSRLSGEQLMQVQTKNIHAELEEEAADLLAKTAKKINSVGLAQLATRFRQGDDTFGKVKKMISDMIQRLIIEEANEADHKQWCDKETKVGNANRDKHSKRVDQLTVRIDKANAGIANLTKRVNYLNKELADMNAHEAEATETRHAEHAEYKQLVKDAQEGQAAVQKAIGVLQEYYGKASFVQVKAHTFLKTNAPEFGGPIFEGGYEKKADGSEGVIGMLEVVESDLAKQLAEAQAEETQAANDFKKMVQENAVSRTTKQTEAKGKQQEIKQLQTAVADNKSDRVSANKELDAVMKYLEKLRGSCVHKPMSFEERQARRKQEIESLKEALNILSGEA